MIVFNKKEYFKPKFKKTVDAFSKALSDVYLINAFSPKIVETVAILAIFSIFIFGYLLHKDITMIAQFLIVFTIAAYRVIPSMNKIILSSNYIKSNSYMFQYFNKVDDSQVIENKKSDNEEVKDISFNQKLEIKDLSFKFHNKNSDTLHHLNLTISKGQTIGIVGTSGAGKTTLLNILLRLYEETNGGIYIDNTKINKTNLHAWYKLVSYVPQNITLLDATITENIAFGISKENIDNNVLKKVIAQAQLQDFITNLTDGINTQIGEKGIKISGGQRQRIGIARALYHGGQLLIFDEATSSLDNETEQMLTEAINNISHKELTIIIVAHRIQTLKYCDAIYKLDNGEAKLHPIN
ncbi:MAG: ATP-binding cassette domain-containing protein, partial [Bacteroidia bacterium]